MKIQEFEAILARLNEQGIPPYAVNHKECHPALLYAYAQSQKLGNELIDLSECIWEYDIAPIVGTLWRLGVETFTISVRQGNLIDILALFKEAGAELQGITQVNNYAGEKTPALLMKIM